MCAAVLAMSGLSFASAKYFHVSLSSTIVVGQTQLKPGNYTVSVKGSNAVFEREENAKTVSVPVKVQNTNTKYSDTKVRTVTEGDTLRLKLIDVGGSDTELEF